MRRLLVVVGLLLMTSPAALAVPPQQLIAPAAATANTVTVQVDRTAIRVNLGGKFSFSTIVRNGTAEPVSGLIAHLSVFSTDPDTYVDPEDWSSHRTQFLDSLPAHGSTELSWPVQAVNSGPLILYVEVTDVATRSVTVSDPIELTVKKQQTINAGGILPLAMGVPGAVAALLAMILLRRRRPR